jgi:hypothetical protein
MSTRHNAPGVPTVFALVVTVLILALALSI